MKKLVQLFLAIVILCSTYQGARAQKTITQSDFQSLIGTTQTLSTYTSTDTAGLQALMADTGAARVWNITSREFALNSEQTVEYRVYPDGAPLANDSAFLQSTIVTRTTSPGSGVVTWGFGRVDATGYFVNGSVNDDAGDRYKFTLVPPIANYRFPTTFRNYWDGYSNQTVTPPSGFPTTSYINYDAYVDGYGTVQTPEGTFQCLRIVVNVSLLFGNITSYLFVDGPRTYAVINYSPTFNQLSVSYTAIKPTSVLNEVSGVLPTSYDLQQNYPNPFNPTTKLSFSVPHSSHITLKVFNVLGNEVATLVNEFVKAGIYETSFDGNRLPSGVYFYRLQGEGFIDTKRMLLLK